MPELKEHHRKPGKAGNGTTGPALTSKQAAKLMIDKYRKELDQRPDGPEGETEYAVDHVEDSALDTAGRIGDKATSRKPKKRDSQPRKKDAPRQNGTGQTTAQNTGRDPAPMSDRSISREGPGAHGPSPKQVQHQMVKQAGENRLKQSPGYTPKQASAEGSAPLSGGQAIASSEQPVIRERPITSAVKERPHDTLGAHSAPKQARAAERPAQIKARQKGTEAVKGDVQVQPATDLPPQATPAIKERPATVIKERGAYKTAQPTGASRTAGRPPSSRDDSMSAQEAGRRLSRKKEGRSLDTPDGSSAHPAGTAAEKRTTSRDRAATARRRGLSDTAPTRKGRTQQQVPGRAGSRATTPKGRGASSRKSSFSLKTNQMPVKSSVIKTGKAAKQTAQRQAAKQAAKKASAAAKKTIEAAKRVIQAAAKAVASLVSALAGLLGGGVLVVIVIVVIVIGAVASSPFGLFFAEEGTGPGAMSVSDAVATVNAAYTAKLEELQTGDYDSFEVDGQAADWGDVLAVFAARYAAAEDGIDVATLDADRVERLAAVFWDMTTITTSEEVVDEGDDAPEADADPDDEADGGESTGKILHITITAKSADDMRTEYHFTDLQNSALDELLSDRASLSAMAGNPSITSAEAQAVLKNLPADLSSERKAVVAKGLSLCGKVNYFWGGKSLVLGWDSRWGQVMQVWAEGSSTTGTYRPYGLDCSGYVDWVFYNATGAHTIPAAGAGHSSSLPTAPGSPGVRPSPATWFSSRT